MPHLGSAHFASGHFASASLSGGSEAASAGVGVSVGASPGGDGKGARRRYRRRTRYGVTLAPRADTLLSVSVTYAPPVREVQLTTSPVRGLVVAGIPSLPRIQPWHLALGAAVVGCVAYAIGRRASPPTAHPRRGKPSRKGGT